MLNLVFLGIRGFEFLKMDGQTDQFKQSLKDLTNMEDNKWPPIVYGTAEGDDQAQPSKKWAYIKWKAWSEGLPIWDFEIWGQVHPANLPDIIEQKDLDPRNFNHINWPKQIKRLIIKKLGSLTNLNIELLLVDKDYSNSQNTVRKRNFWL